MRLLEAFSFFFYMHLSILIPQAYNENLTGTQRWKAGSSFWEHFPLTLKYIKLLLIISNIYLSLYPLNTVSLFWGSIERIGTKKKLHAYYVDYFGFVE